jgi:IS605 OrfB family transposase
MQLVEQHIVKRGHSPFTKIDELCFKSKNLYNAGLYEVRQAFFQNQRGYLNYNALQKKFQTEKQKDYCALPAKVSQQILMLLDRNFKSFFEALKAFKVHPSKFLARPKIPKYKDKIKGRNLLIYTIQALSKPWLKKGIIQFSGTDIQFKTNVKFKEIQQVRMIPNATCYTIEVVYNVVAAAPVPFNGRIASIDIGLNNLATLTSNGAFAPWILNGKPLKSINQFYNKKKAKLQAALKKEQKTSRRIQALTHKRNHKVKDYLHQSSRYVMNQLVSNQISVLVIGKNDQWKQEIALGSRTNQNFVQIPHATFIDQLKYKAQLVGIRVVLQEESYTSKCSFLDGESIQKHPEYQGKRVKRGLFRSKNGTVLNADVNGSANILKKAFPTAFEGYGIEGAVVHPIRVMPYKKAI